MTVFNFAGRQHLRETFVIWMTEGLMKLENLLSAGLVFLGIVFKTEIINCLRSSRLLSFVLLLWCGYCRSRDWWLTFQCFRIALPCLRFSLMLFILDWRTLRQLVLLLFLLFFVATGNGALHCLAKENDFPSLDTTR